MRIGRNRSSRNTSVPESGRRATQHGRHDQVRAQRARDLDATQAGRARSILKCPRQSAAMPAPTGGAASIRTSPAPDRTRRRSTSPGVRPRRSVGAIAGKLSRPFTTRAASQRIPERRILLGFTFHAVSEHPEGEPRPRRAAGSGPRGTHDSGTTAAMVSAASPASRVIMRVMPAVAVPCRWPCAA